MWETKDPTEKKNGFDKFLKKMREVESDKFAYPGNISDRDIQMAVRLCLPGEVAKQAEWEIRRELTQLTWRRKSTSTERVKLQLELDS